MNNTILIVDSSPEVLENTREYLEMSGNRVFTATDGHAGYDLAKTHKPDIIICDYLLEESKGRQLIRKLRNDIETENIPVIILSEGPVALNGHSADDMCINAYVIKPFTFEEIETTIKSCLNGKIA